MMAKTRFRIRDCCIAGFGIAVIGLGVAWAGNMACEPTFNGIVDAILLPNTNIVCSVGNLCSDTNHTFTWSASTDGGTTYTTNATQTGSSATIVAPALPTDRFRIKCEVGGHKASTIGPKSVLVVYVSSLVPSMLRQGRQYPFRLQVHPTNAAFTACSQTLVPSNGANPFAILTGTNTSITTNLTFQCHRRYVDVSDNFMEADNDGGEIARWFAQIPGDNRFVEYAWSNGNSRICAYVHRYSLAVGSTTLNGTLPHLTQVEVADKAETPSEDIDGAIGLDETNGVWYIADQNTFARFTPVFTNIVMTNVENNSVFRGKTYQHECEHVRQAAQSGNFTNVTDFYNQYLSGYEHGCCSGLLLYVDAVTLEYKYNGLWSVFSSNTVLERERGAFIEGYKETPDYLEMSDEQVVQYAGAEYQERQQFLIGLRNSKDQAWTNLLKHTHNP